MIRGLLLILFTLWIQPGISQEVGVTLVVLGTVQDGGSPHIGCSRSCCTSLFENPDPMRKVVSLGIVDREEGTSYLFEATPNLPAQLKLLKAHAQTKEETPTGIFLTHAHIGHYIGLMYLGREALGANAVPVYAMPKMKHFLENNGPWSQLVSLGNIGIAPLQAQQPVTLSEQLQVVPFLVPHRDEFSETVGYTIIGPNKKVLFIPDIDKWDQWDTEILEAIQGVDYAFLDATFFDGEEINTRDISEIPHPFVIESLALFKGLPESEKRKIHFIHFNHTNPLLEANSSASAQVGQLGFKIAKLGQVFQL